MESQSLRQLSSERGITVPELKRNLSNEGKKLVLKVLSSDFEDKKEAGNETAKETKTAKETAKNTYKLTVYDVKEKSKRKIKLKIDVDMKWPEVVEMLKRDPHCLKDLYEDKEMNECVSEWPNGDFLSYYGSYYHVELYAIFPPPPLPSKLKSRVQNKKHDTKEMSLAVQKKFEAFKRWASTNERNKTTTEAIDIGHFANQYEINTLKATFHAEERNEERSVAVSNAIQDLNNSESCKFLIPVIYKGEKGKGERFFLYTHNFCYVLNIDLTKIITLWELNYKFNAYYKNEKSKKNEKDEKRKSISKKKNNKKAVKSQVKSKKKKK